MYMTLTRAENAFRMIKTPLAERPIFHHLEHRVDTHIFLCVLAYHLLVAIETTLLNQGGAHLLGHRTSDPRNSSGGHDHPADGSGESSPHPQRNDTRTGALGTVPTARLSHRRSCNQSRLGAERSRPHSD